MAVLFSEDLKGQVAVVTGGGGVLCGAFSHALAASGVKVAILDIQKEAADSVAKSIVDSGGVAIGVEADVLDLDSLRRAEKTVFETFGPWRILINGAGGNHPRCTSDKETVSSDELAESLEGSFFAFDPSGIDFVFGLNYKGTVNTCLAFGERMAKAGQGTIINISSMASHHPLTKVMAYSSAKAAINNFTEWLAVHLAPCGVRVNALAPGFFLTEQNRNLLMGEDGKPSPRCQKILDNTPMKRLGDPKDLLGTLFFLASDEASGFVTGTVIPIDGGFQAFAGV